MKLNVHPGFTVHQVTESSVGSQKVLSYSMNEELKNCGSGDPGLIPNPDSLYELMRYAKVVFKTGSKHHIVCRFLVHLA